MFLSLVCVPGVLAAFSSLSLQVMKVYNRWDAGVKPDTRVSIGAIIQIFESRK